MHLIQWFSSADINLISCIIELPITSASAASVNKFAGAWTWWLSLQGDTMELRLMMDGGEHRDDVRVQWQWCYVSCSTFAIYCTRHHNINCADNISTTGDSFSLSYPIHSLSGSKSCGRNPNCPGIIDKPSVAQVETIIQSTWRYTSTPHIHHLANYQFLP